MLTVDPDPAAIDSASSIFDKFAGTGLLGAGGRDDPAAASALPRRLQPHVRGSGAGRRRSEAETRERARSRARDTQQHGGHEVQHAASPSWQLQSALLYVKNHRYWKHHSKHSTHIHLLKCKTQANNVLSIAIVIVTKSQLDFLQFINMFLLIILSHF